MRHGALSKCGGAFAQQLELFQGGRTRRCPTALALERSPVDDRGTCEKGGRLVQVQEPELLADRPLVQGVPQEDRSGRSKRMIFLAVEPDFNAQKAARYDKAMVDSSEGSSSTS